MKNCAGRQKMVITDKFNGLQKIDDRQLRALQQ